MNGWQKFGDRARFAIEFQFVSDPHKGQGSRPGLAASWGMFRLWVQDHNLCEHRAQGELYTDVAWYLLPLFGWLAENWDPLFHECHLPEPLNINGVRPSARHAYRQGLRAIFGDANPRVEHRAEAWQRWWQRHALRSCRDGGLFPDVFIRRLFDSVEISWGNQVVPGTPSDFHFTVPFDTLYLEVEQVAEPLYLALEAATQAMCQLDVAAETEIAALHQAVRRISKTPSREREGWYLHGEPGQQSDAWSIRTVVLSTALGKVPKAAQALIESTPHPLYIRELSPAAVMFGSAAPTIGQADAELLIRTLLAAFTRNIGPTAHDSLVQDQPLAEIRAAHEEGYDLALDLLDTLSLPDEQMQHIDVVRLLHDLEIIVSRVEMEDDELRGVALAGPDLQPTILVNIHHPMNQRESGYRFTLAHELCHILHDRGYARRVSLISSPWAPPGVERRANAFAAMLLMPLELVNRLIAYLPSPDLADVNAIEQLAYRMGTGFVATLEHLTNLGKLTDGERERIKAEALRKNGFDA